MRLRLKAAEERAEKAEAERDRYKVALQKATDLVDIGVTYLPEHLIDKHEMEEALKELWEALRERES